MAYNLFVYSNNENIGIVDNIQSLQWLENYNDLGEFQLIVFATDVNLKLMKKDNILYKTDSEVARIIESIEINDKEKQPFITVRGRSLTALLDKRVVMGTVNINNVELGMRKMVADNIRDLPIQLGTLKGYTETFKTQYSWNSIANNLIDLASATGFGFKCVFNPDTGISDFVVYKGIDRSYGTNDYNGYFGTDINNVKEQYILDDNKDYFNVAVVAGEVKDNTREFVIINNITDNSKRKELFVDARDLQSTYQVTTDTGNKDSQGNPIYSTENKTYTSAEYQELLKQRGLEKLAETKVKETIKITVEPFGIMELGRDYNLGDIVSYKSERYGIEASLRIVELKQVYDVSGYQVFPTLGIQMKRRK